MSTRIKYSGTAPTASETVTLFDTTVAFPFANGHQDGDIKRFSMSVLHLYSGTINLYRSVNRGSTWTQMSTQLQQPITTSGQSYYDVFVGQYADFKVEWVNGTVAQTTWEVGMALQEDQHPGWSFADEIRRLGAIAHFDPSSGATDDGTTSTWVDRIGGYSVASTSQATRMTYSASVAGLNNRPGFVGVAASSTKLVGAAGLADLIDGSAAFTQYVVYRPTSVATLGSVCGVGSTTLQNAAYMYFNASTGRTGTSRIELSASTQSLSFIETTTDASVTSLVYSGSTVSIWNNGSPGILASSNTRAGVCDRFVIGANIYVGAYGQHGNVVVGDIIVFLGAHTDAERMYVERLIAAKYGWPVLQGLSGFSAANYLVNAGLTSGPRGSTANGVWIDVLMRPNAIPSGVQIHASAYNGLTGYAVASTGAGLYLYAQNGSVAASSPTRTIVASEVGKLMLFGGTAGPGNLARTYTNGVEVGAGTALTGYATNSAVRYDVGQRLAASPASSYSIFGLVGGDVEQAVANHAARAAEIKAANAFVTTGGVAATHGWALNGVASTYSDLVGSDALTLTGTLTAAQIIVPTWPW